MRIGLLTFHRAYNYGAVLQCYALSKKIYHLGGQCEVIDYYPSYFKEIYLAQKAFSIRHPPIKTWIRRAILYSILKKRTEKFDAFVNKMPLSDQQYSTQRKLEKDLGNYDLLITGSDQVWNNTCALFDPTYFLDFNNCEIPKYSYAASFGFLKIPNNLKAEYQRRLSTFSRISVRENQAITILNSLGINTEKVQVSCDPTLLLTGKEWADICDCIPNELKPYILIYYVKETDVLQKKAVQIRNKTGLNVICVTCNMDINVLKGENDKKYAFDFRSSCSPEEFLKLIKEAEVVLTNSFHGTVFSLLFHKKFQVQIKVKNDKNSRVLDLLNMVRIPAEEVSIQNDNFFEPCWEKVDFEIEKSRKRSEKYLLQVIKGE